MVPNKKEQVLPLLPALFCLGLLVYQLKKSFQSIHSLSHVIDGIYGAGLRPVDIFQWDAIEPLVLDEM